MLAKFLFVEKSQGTSDQWYMNIYFSQNYEETEQMPQFLYADYDMLAKSEEELGGMVGHLDDVFRRILKVNMKKSKTLIFLKEW